MTLHAIRDCIHAKKVWDLCVPKRWRKHFFLTQDVKEWVRKNITIKGRLEDFEWRQWFPIICHNIWLAHNDRVFQGSLPSHQDTLVQSRACLAWSSLVLHVSNTVAMPCWEPPDEGKVKFNVDGSLDVTQNLRGCSGLARNHESMVLCGFLYRMPSGSILSTEIWSILWALKVAWDRGFRNLEIEGDCVVAVNVVIEGVGEEHPDLCVVQEAQMMLKQDWRVNLLV
ncbi:uncharacterized protein LOC114752789 [Neltuma alba]|uniref:uncharacterized protein LOC114752789 n=1 Tax=Neltuma alba TaxID=207710 RepID=UPI0010A3F8A6|nr:uncharacterized protein LOC114752789 [Prosopis alba]